MAFQAWEHADDKVVRFNKKRSEERRSKKTSNTKLMSPVDPSRRMLRDVSEIVGLSQTDQYALIRRRVFLNDTNSLPLPSCADDVRLNISALRHASILAAIVKTSIEERASKNPPQDVSRFCHGWRELTNYDLLKGKLPKGCPKDEASDERALNAAVFPKA
jgi:hypothetical protein